MPVKKETGPTGLLHAAELSSGSSSILWAVGKVTTVAVGGIGMGVLVGVGVNLIKTSSSLPGSGIFNGEVGTNTKSKIVITSLYNALYYSLKKMADLYFQELSQHNF